MPFAHGYVGAVDPRLGFTPSLLVLLFLGASHIRPCLTFPPGLERCMVQNQAFRVVTRIGICVQLILFFLIREQQVYTMLTYKQIQLSCKKS
jgi:hypothetical protein